MEKEMQVAPDPFQKGPFQSLIKCTEKPEAGHRPLIAQAPDFASI